MEAIIIVGNATGIYTNKEIEKEFECKVLVSARPGGTVIVHNLAAGVRPICLVDAEVAIARIVTDDTVILKATTEDGQELTLTFNEVIAIQGVPPDKASSSSLSMNILKCVFDLGGAFGRTAIAQILTGTIPRKIIPAHVEQLGTYGIAKDSTMKEVLALIDWLVEEGYLAFATVTRYPTLIVTAKGLDVLAEGDNLEVDCIPQEDLEAAADLHDKLAAGEHYQKEEEAIKSMKEE